MSPANDDGSLKTLLTPTQRQQLRNLLTAASATLRAHIIQTFPPETPPPSEKTSLLKATTLSSFDTWRTSALSRFTEAIEQSPSTTKPSNLFSRPHAEDPQKPSPPITTLPAETKKKILAALLLILLSLHTYDSRSRILLLDITRHLQLPISTLIDLESTTAIGLLEAANSLDSEGNPKDNNSSTNKWGIGLATVAGAALIGVTGGLAAPLVAAGITSVMGGLGLGATAMATYLGAAASSSAFVGTLFGAYGARRSNEIAGRYAAEVSDFKLERLGGEEGERRMRIAIGVTGWIEEDAEKEVKAPWVAFSGDAVAAYALRWETAVLEDLGKGAGNVLSDYATGWVKGQIIRRTIFATLSAALWPMGLLKAAKVVDNPFANAMRMSRKTGLVLANALLERAQGERPVTLVGFSLGGRVVWECCRELARKGGYGIIENVVILGAPVPADEDDWRELRSIVAGRVVNVYSEKDWILAFLYRTANLQLGVAGLQEVKLHGVENVNVAEEISGHLKYRYKVPFILRDVLGEDVKFEDGDVPSAPKTPVQEKDEAANEEEFGKRVEMAEKELEMRRKEREGKENVPGKSQKEVS